MPFRLATPVLLFVMLFHSALDCAAAADPNGLPPPTEKLLVGIHDKPPYAFQDGDGSWDGLGVRLWEAIAKEKDLSFEYVELAYEDLIPALAEKRVALVVGELLVNSFDEEVMDFSQPYLETHVGIAVSSRTWNPSWVQILLHAFDWSILRLFLSMVPIFIVVSFFLWWLERKRKDGHFADKPTKAIGSAFWFSAVTFTSTGYGDKVPVSFAGRAVAVVWMLMSLLLVTAFTASVASTVASVKTGGVIRSIADLQHYRNAALNGSVSQRMLQEYHAPIVSFETYEEAFGSLLGAEVDTVVGDVVSFQYLIRTQFSGRISLLPLRIFFGRVAFGLPRGSEHREWFNIAMLQQVRSAEWQATLREFLVDQPQTSLPIHP